MSSWKLQEWRTVKRIFVQAMIGALLIASGCAGGLGSSSEEGSGFYCARLCERTQAACEETTIDDCVWVEAAVCLRYQKVQDGSVWSKCSPNLDDCEASMRFLRSDAHLVETCKTVY